MLNSTGTCEHCGGKLRNIEGKRLSIPDLTALHDHSCPGLHRRKK